MKIPKQFELGGIVVTVEMDTTLHQRKGMIGEARYGEQKIVIDPTIAATETTEQVFWHELVHYITFMMSEDELRNNERFIDIAAHFLYQAVKSSRGEWDDGLKGMGEVIPESNAKLMAHVSEPLVPLSSGLLEYASWMKEVLYRLVSDGSSVDGRQVIRKMRDLIDGEVMRLERELVRQMIG